MHSKDNQEAAHCSNKDTHFFKFRYFFVSFINSPKLRILSFLNFQDLVNYINTIPVFPLNIVPAHVFDW